MHFFDKFWLWAPAPALGDGLADDFVVLFVSSTALRTETILAHAHPETENFTLAR
jgi:hypothetical protein